MPQYGSIILLPRGKKPSLSPEHARARRAAPNKVMGTRPLGRGPPPAWSITNLGRSCHSPAGDGTSDASSTHRAHGASGKVILGELPVTKTYRAKKWFSSVFMLVAGALLLQGTPYITYAILMADSSDGEVFLIPVAMFILGIILWAGSIQLIGSVLKYEIELTAEGEEREEGFSFGDSLKDVGGRLS